MIFILTYLSIVSIVGLFIADSETIVIGYSFGKLDLDKSIKINFTMKDFC